ncbi:MAG TPA: hypothetical protein DEP84_18940 [Chloroflexi bacterium]|nr:hypothetical protein [Chloroflexota bacterium]
MDHVETFQPYAEPHSRERLAWAILLTAFFVFAVLAVSVPLTARWYIHNATRAQPATVQGSSATTLISMAGAPGPLALQAGGRQENVGEGSTISTDNTSQAIITLFDRSQITVFPNSQVTLQRMRRPRFSRSSRPNEIVAGVTRGRVRATIPPAGERSLRFDVRTPQAHASLGEGSTAIEVSNDVSHVSVRAGTAMVAGQTGQPVSLAEGQRSDVRLGQAASSPLPAARNLIRNGDFENLLAVLPIKQGAIADGWEAYNDQGGDGGEVDGSVEAGTWGSRRAVRFYRSGSNNNHGETGVRQDLGNKYVGDYRSLRLRLDINIVSQSLSGGGYLSSEFPVIVRVNYRDAYGNENHWTHGFYYQNPANYHIENGELIARDTWYSYEGPNLKDLIPNLAFISSIQIYASGWDYEAFVSDAGLIAE